MAAPNPNKAPIKDGFLTAPRIQLIHVVTAARDESIIIKFGIKKTPSETPGFFTHRS